MGAGLSYAGIEKLQHALKYLISITVLLSVGPGAQTNLGFTLANLGDRESGTARLEEAVVAYRAALEELTRDRMPLQWAGADART